jgi:hypothetical protein
MGERINGPVKRLIEAVGQPYVDEPVYKRAPVYVGKVPMEGNVVRYFKRTPLEWMKPAKGGLEPMESQERHDA